MEKTETHKFKVHLTDNQYYDLQLKDDIEFEIEDLQQLVVFEKELSGKRLPVLVYCPPTAITNNELIKYLSQNKNNPYSLADAFVITSLSQKILANVYTKFSKPERPVNFFNKKEDALLWLKQFML